MSYDASFAACFGRTTALLFLVFFSCPTNGFIVRNHRTSSISIHSSTTRKTKINWHFSESTLKSTTRTTTTSVYASIKEVQSTLFPPIHLQEKPRESFWHHFQPRFMIKELLLGVQYMCRVHWLLLGSWMLGRLFLFKSGLVDYVGMEKFLSQLGDSPFMDIYHIPDALARIFLLKSDICHKDSFMYDCAVVPILEEISHRGLIHWLWRFLCRVDLWILAWTSNLWEGGILSFAYLISVIAHQVNITCNIVRYNSSGLSHKLIVNVLDWIGFVLFLPARLHFWNLVKISVAKKRRFNWNDICTMDGTSKSLSLPKRTPRQRYNRQADDAMIRRSISRSICWKSSCVFGLAHYGRPSLSSRPFARVLSVQKCTMTLLSSLVVECRLAINRRTLWGSIGAHAAHNALIHSSFSRFIQLMFHPQVIMTLPWDSLLLKFCFELLMYMFLMNFAVRALNSIIEMDIFSALD